MPEVARVVAEAVVYHDVELRSYDLHAFVVMPNHVHLLVDPLQPMAKVMQSLKGYTARQANRLLGRTGQPFWQKESYDHWVRDAAEFAKITHYVEHNPVKAGLVSTPEEWPWSSAACA